MGLVDAVYPLGGGSRWQNNELRYSLRSLEANFEVRNVYLLSLDKPEWYTGNHIKVVENGNRLKNVFEKQTIACTHPYISENFLYMNDDFFLLEPFEPKHYYFKTVQWKWKDIKVTSKYYSFIQSLPDWLNFCVHAPWMINKEEWLDIMEDVKLVPGFMPKDRYGNQSVLWDQEELEGDSKYRDRDAKGLGEFIKGKKFFSTPSTMKWQEMPEFFETLYPNKSRWEK